MKNFIKSLSVLIVSILLISGAFAEKTDVKTAQALATNFYYEKGLLSGHDLKQPAELSLTYTQLNNNEEIYYVFSSDNGYIIVAADDAVYPVLAYSYEKKYSTKNISPEFSSWMSTYEDQIVHIRKNNIKAGPNISEAWKTYTTDFDPTACLKSSTKSVAPLLTSTWNQGTYYNYLCPEDTAGTDGHVYTGCVATAMAQVMYYYRYPAVGNGTHSYYSSYGNLSADFGATIYNWYEMQNDTWGKYNYSMALLQLHCGIAIDMDYSPDGSGAYMWDDVEAMKAHFGYSSSTELIYKDDHPTDWENLLRIELDNKRPIQYAGYGEGGHAFVCDGYQGTDFFHFNWGWGGAYDGYFYVDNLNPGYTFNYGQQAIINSYPAKAFPVNCAGLTTITSTYGTIEDGSSPKYNYQDNKDCMWLIAPTEPIDNIRISFDRLNTENSNDYVTIYDGETTNAPVLGVFSGNTIPADIVSTGNKVLVRFTTNGSNVADGWLITFNGKLTKFCSGVAELTAPSGIISDGSDTYNYNNNTLCRWLISPPNAGTITITFNNIDLAADNDFIKIYDNISGTKIMTLYSGDMPQTFTAYTGKVLLLFFTNAVGNASGWELSYTSAPLAVEENNTAFVSISPNPASDKVNILASVAESASLNLAIYNNLGSTVFSKQASAENGLIDETIDISHLSKGLYFLKLSSEKFNSTQKLIIR